MLIRITQHYPNNPSHIDKLIAIKGLPEDWLFRTSRFGGKELVYPWEPDVEENIPEHIRHLCEPTEITQVFPPIEKGRDYVVDKKTILGLKFSYMTEPGQVLWDKIERYLDRMTPRDQKVPQPVLVAPNHKDNFNPHAVRKTVRGSLELYKSEIPVVDLRTVKEEPAAILVSYPTTAGTGNTTVTINQTPQPPITAPTLAAEFQCDQCDKKYAVKQHLTMHKMGKHRVRKKAEPIGV